MSSIRLMTANLLHVHCDEVGFASLLDRVSPDVLVTQELAPPCARVIAATFPHHHLDPSLDFTGRGIASRLQAEFGDIPMPVRDGTWARMDVDGRPLYLVGMHLMNPIEFPWWRSVRTRRGQLDALFQWAATHGVDISLVVAGDMNSSPSWPAYKRLAARWDDLVADHAERSGAEPRRTWGWRPGWPRLLRIDHVFGTGVGITGVSVEVVEGSDHNAVVADLTV